MCKACNKHGSTEVRAKFSVMGREEKRPLERLRHKWHSNIKMVFRGMECGLASSG
jgi:hypothetical protein